MKSEPEITMSKEEYEAFRHAYRKLIALESAGVDNWEGYDYAMELLGEEYTNV